MKERVIVWRITQTCNMNCRFCSYSNEVERLRSDADEAEITRLCGVLADYKQRTGDDLLVSWIGGEPLLWDQLLKHSAFLHENGVRVSTTTNGLLLGRKDIQEGILRHFSEIVCSLDGYETCNDDVRQHRGHFQLVSKHIRELARLRDEMDSPLKIKVNTILMRRNIRQFPAFCEYLNSLGVDEVTFNQLGGFDRPEFFEDNRLTPEQAEELCRMLPEMQADFAKRGLIIHGSPKYLERIRLTTRNERNPIAECEPGTWFWFINENGYISPCSYTSYEYKFPTSEIRTPEDFDRAEAFFRRCRCEARSKWCDDCFCTQVYDKFA